ncbi:putative oxidoreductase YusZ [Naviculisporaceae sp. PSN 640]
MSSQVPVWFITGSSSGFGEAIAFEALKRGHKVIATARNSTKLSKLQEAGASIMDLDVTSDEDTLKQKLAQANNIYGRITHVASCAGYILEGTVEEASAKEVYDQYNTNVFGTFNIARVVTPYLREAAKKGYLTALANFGSLGSWTSSAAVAHYCSTKFAVTGLTIGLAEELKPFGISVCSIEPGYTRTGFLANPGEGKEGGGAGHRVKTARRLSVYDSDDNPAAAVRGGLEAYNGKQPNDVVKCARVIVDVLTGTGVADGKEVPVRLVLGKDCLEAARKMCEESLGWLKEWQGASASVGHDDE